MPLSLHKKSPTATDDPQGHLCRSEAPQRVGGGTASTESEKERGGSLGIYASNAVADKNRRERYARRAKSSRWILRDFLSGHDEKSGWVKPPRLARCSWSIGQIVTMNHEKGARAHFGSVEHCASIWGCPVCASVIRARRAKEITAAVEQHQAAGGAIAFVTLTLPHAREDSLALTLDTVLEGWRSLTASRAWKKEHGIKTRYGVSGYIRAIEVTLGQNGWHPHAHILLFLDEKKAPEELKNLGDEVHQIWASWVTKKLGKTPTRAHGIDVQAVDTSGKVLSRYISKIQDEKAKKWGAAAELTRADLKTGKRESITPFQLLDDEATPFSDGQRSALWLEYVEATKGRRCITWSRGLKKFFSLEEKTDEEIIEKVETAPAVWIIPAKIYNQRRTKTSENLPKALEALEAGHWEELAILMPGEAYNPPDGGKSGESLADDTRSTAKGAEPVKGERSESRATP